MKTPIKSNCLILLTAKQLSRHASKLKPVVATYSCIAKKAHISQQPRCRICGEILAYGDGVVTLKDFTYYSKCFRYHGKCMIACGQRALEEEKKLETYRAIEQEKVENRQIRNAEVKRVSALLRETARFRKQIIKDALKTQNVLLSKIYISRNAGMSINFYCLGSDSKFRVSAFKNSQQGPAICIEFSGDQVTVKKAAYFNEYMPYRSYRHKSDHPLGLTLWEAALPDTGHTNQWYPTNSKDTTLSLADPNSLEIMGKAIMALDVGNITKKQKRKKITK